jgi:hypothetical protein
VQVSWLRESGQDSLSDFHSWPSQVAPVAGCKFPRLQLRGSAGFSPASHLIIDKDAQTKEVVKEQSEWLGKSTRPECGSQSLVENSG